MATQKKRQAKKSARAWCVRAARRVREWRDRGTWCGVRAVRACGEARAECVQRSRWEYPSAVVGYEMRYAPWIVYNHRAPASRPPSSPVNVPSARQKRPRRAPKRRFRHVTIEPPLQAAAAERVGHNAILCISYGMGFYRVKPAIGAEGVRPGYTTATATHSTPQIFFRQLAPFALALHL
jgi:hypothetical protein